MPANRFYDQKSAGVNKVSVAPAVYAADPVPVACDMIDSEGPLHAVITLGVIGAANTCSITFTECATSGGTYTAIPNSPTITVLDTDDGTIVVSAPFERTLRFVKVVPDLGGTISCAMACSVHASKKST